MREARAKRFGLKVVSAIEEWSDAKLSMKGGSILDAVRFYNAHHLGVPTKLFTDVADECISAKEAVGISPSYHRSLRNYLSWMKRDFGPQTSPTSPRSKWMSGYVLRMAITRLGTTFDGFS